jgi:tRNA(Ile2) C34 agmatinyltransferase TiaS
MNVNFVIFFLIFIFSGCTVYTEKQSEALSRVVYATKDSLESARIDLADKYSTESTRLVKPPKNRIDVKAVYKKNVDNVTSSNKVTPTIINKQRVIVVPEKYKNDTLVVVSSEEYQQLLKDKETFAQIEKDNAQLIATRDVVDQELIRQMEYNDKMVRDLNAMQRKLVEKDLAILQRSIIIITLLISIAAAIYLKIKGIL